MIEMRSFLRVLGKRARRAFAPAKHHVGFFVSFPKSGRTWLRVILDELNMPLDYKHDGAKHSTPRPFEELTLCGKHYAARPVVFLSRDPRDTAISGFFQKTLRRDGYAGSLSDFIRDPLHGVEKIVRYNLTWLERGSRLPAFLPITYEETSADAVGVVRMTAAFLRVDVVDADIERVVADNTFTKMRAREASGQYRERYSDALTPADLGQPDSYKVRRGKVGGYRDYLSAEDMAYCDAIFQRHGYFEKLQELLTCNAFRQCCGRQTVDPLREELA
jgi:hypothetical protein